MFGYSLDNLKKIIVVMFGFTVLIIGVALLVLPGPGIPVVIFGLIILAGEFVWARKLLKKVKEEARKVRKEAKKVGRLI